MYHILCFIMFFLFAMIAVFVGDIMVYLIGKLFRISFLVDPDFNLFAMFIKWLSR